MTHLNPSTPSRAAFTAAWTGFCRTGEGRQEYWHRFGGYLFQTSARDIPPELRTLPPYITRPGVRRQRAARRASIRSLVAAAEKTGKTVTGVTMPDGTVLHFGEPAPAAAAVDASKMWDEALAARRRASDAQTH